MFASPRKNVLVVEGNAALVPPTKKIAIGRKTNNNRGVMYDRGLGDGKNQRRSGDGIDEEGADLLESV